MAQETASTSRETLSLQTLVIAAVASGVAAVVVSHFWSNGTVFAAAMTPVVVSIVKELLQRPMQSEALRRSASRVSSVAVAPARRAVTTGGGTRTRSGTRVAETPPPRETPPRRFERSNGNGAPPAGDVLHAGPRRTYGPDGGRRRFQLSPKQLRIAIVTGVLAFVVAVAALTLPELIFGGAVTSGHRTTIFGGKDSSSDKGKDEQKDNQSGDNGDQQTPQDQGTQTEPSQTETQPQDQGDQTQTQPDQQEPPSSSQPPDSGGGGDAQPSPSPAPAPPVP